MTSEQKRFSISIDKKYKILQMLEEGASESTIATEYNIELSFVRYIFAQRENIKACVEKNTVIVSRSTKRLLWTPIWYMERVLYHWCMRCKEGKIEITGADVQRKALELNEKLKGNRNFKASKSWFLKFRKRYGFTLEDIKGYLPAPTKTAGDKFKSHFMKLLRCNWIKPKNVYNVDYTAIMWKAIPVESSIFRYMKSTGNQKMCEDHVTALFCTNATGCHKLPVLIIGSIAKPENSPNLDTNTYSTIYKVNTTAWMDSTIFNEWFEEHFLTSVKERQLKEMRREKTLLLLDNTRSLHNLRDLNKKDEFVKVMSIPLDVTQHIQPMNNGIIACFKRMYRKELMVTLMLLPLRNVEQAVIDTYEKLSMWDFCRMVHEAWLRVNNIIFIRAWDELYMRESISPKKYLQIVAKEIDEIYAFLHIIPGCKQCDKTSVINWIQIENKRDIAMKICTDEVLRDFQNDILEQVNIDTDNDETGPSHLKILRMN